MTATRAALHASRSQVGDAILCVGNGRKSYVVNTVKECRALIRRYLEEGVSVHASDACDSRVAVAQSFVTMIFERATSVEMIRTVSLSNATRESHASRVQVRRALMMEKSVEINPRMSTDIAELCK